MTKPYRKIWVKIIGSILVPVFLFTIFPQTTTAQSETLIPVTFQIKNSLDNSTILSTYGLQARLLFQNIFKAKVSPAIFNLMSKDLKISYVQIDRPMQAAVITPSDPFFTADPLQIDKQWYLAKTHMAEAWEYTTGSSNVIVAIVDTGIHASHIELNDGRIIAGYDIVLNKAINANANSDDNGHGTAVSGVIGAIPNNAKGITGVNWNISIMPVKALSAEGTGDTSAVAAGIVWAADHGANIINLSLGGPGFGTDLTLSNAISYAYNKGSLIVAAAGNDLVAQGLNLDASPVYPICGDNGNNMVLGVAATDENDRKADFSNFGSSCVDISAPGKRIVTSAFLPSDPANNILIYGSGTSLATPIVSGIAALIKAKNNNLSNVEIRNIITKTADPIDFINQNNCLGGSCTGYLGKGRINALTAVAPTPVPNGSLVRQAIPADVYFVANNTKRLVSNFVFMQRGFDPKSIIPETNNQLVAIPSGSPLPPLDGTLIKGPNSTQVYVMDQELKRPLTHIVFISRGYNFANIQTLPQTEVDSYAVGDWYWPPDGTMVLVSGNPTVFVMDKQVRRPVTFFVFNQRRLSFRNVVKVTPDEFTHIPVPPDIFWLPPLDGTLIKSESEPSIYLIENGTRRVMSYEAFVGRNYKFSSVKVLPQAEVDIIALGSVLLTP